MTFSERLKNEMADRGISARGLGRIINPAAPESGRRTIQKYLGGHDVPRRKRRRELAVSLGMDPTAFDELEVPEVVVLLYARLHDALKLVEQL